MKAEDVVEILDLVRIWLCPVDDEKTIEDVVEEVSDYVSEELYRFTGITINSLKRKVIYKIYRIFIECDASDNFSELFIANGLTTYEELEETAINVKRCVEHIDMFEHFEPETIDSRFDILDLGLDDIQDDSFFYFPRSK